MVLVLVLGLGLGLVLVGRVGKSGTGTGTRSFGSCIGTVMGEVPCSRNVASINTCIPHRRSGPTEKQQENTR